MNRQATEMRHKFAPSISLSLQHTAVVRRWGVSLSQASPFFLSDDFAGVINFHQKRILHSHQEPMPVDLLLESAVKIYNCREKVLFGGKRICLILVQSLLGQFKLNCQFILFKFVTVKQAKLHCRSLLLLLLFLSAQISYEFLILHSIKMRVIFPLLVCETCSFCCHILLVSHASSATCCYAVVCNYS